MDQTKLFQQFVAFSAAVHEVTHDIKKQVKPPYITPVQYNILEYIYVSPPVTPSDISDCLHMSLPNTSRELKKLQDKQLIEKHTATDDRRKQTVHLTEEGKKVMKTTFDQIEVFFQQKIQNASQEELRSIEQALQLLQKQLFY
ncbi:MarR family winged helix-turn-helix transcriptional regulator [Lysinibacillus sp. KU-BSD001]|uniref:MarR family winged helix-turn-helix transcriptional regulator n=1 Tax=Lysinibacillus sp. KU-BSD001 TaxID=3141328 RepID=UPI0036EABEE5